MLAGGAECFRPPDQPDLIVYCCAKLVPHQVSSTDSTKCPRALLERI
jgi:hypothetical protein